MGDRHQDLMADEKVLQVRVAVGLAGTVMTVIGAERNELFEPLFDVSNQSLLRIVDIDPGGNVHR